MESKGKTMITSSSADERIISWNPTARLPPLRARPSAKTIQAGLRLVSFLYAPNSSDETRADDIGKVADEDEQDQIDAAKTDETERRYALGWCLRLISVELDWLSEFEAAQCQTRAAHVISAEASLQGTFLHSLAPIDLQACC